MSTTDYPPTPPHLPDARTPPPKDSYNRPSSPDPNCAICLGELENMSYTDSCFHKFCFTCLLEWSKVKPECPLCKAKFKSIIHTIKSDQVYESYTIPPPPRPVMTPESMAFLQEVRRFRYATTGGGSGERFPFFSLPALPIPITNIPLSRSRILDQNRHAPSWRRRGGLATTDVRRNIYRQNMYVNPDSVVDTTGRYRETSPEWFRTNPAQTHRLVPWLNRELNALLEDPQRSNILVTQEILELITQHDIRSNEFRQRIFPYLGIRTAHFQHEFYNFARSCYDMVGHDLHAVYAENPRSNITTEIISSDSSSSSSDSDEIFVLGEFNSDRQPTSDSQRSAGSALRSRRNSSTEATPSTSNGRQHLVDEGPSTSRGISKLTTSQFLISSDEDEANTRRSVDKNSEDGDNVDVEVVGYIKPRHLRTPVIVSLSSEDEDQTEAVKKENVIKNEKVENETIEISDSEEEIQVAPQRWSISSDDEALGRKRVKGKGKGKNSRIKSSGPKSASQQSSSTTTSPPSATVASSSNHESEAVISEPAVTSSPTTASDERSRLISPMGLISTWRSQRTTRNSSSSRSPSREPSTEKYKSGKEKKQKRKKRSGSEKSSRKEDRKRSEEDRSKDRKRKSRKDHEERREERRHKAESDSWRKKDESCGESSKRSRKESDRKRSAVSYSDSEERPLAQRKRQKVKSTTEESRSGSRLESSSRLEENRRDSSPQRCHRDVDDLRYLLSRKKQRESANRRVFLSTSSDSDTGDEMEEPKLKSVIVKIKTN